MKVPYRFAAALLAVLSLSACLSIVTPDRSVTERVVLPNGEVCGYAPEGATLTLDGVRMAWTCAVSPAGPRGLLGAPSVVGETDLTWRLGASALRPDGAGFSLAASELLALRVVRFQTIENLTCAFAGEGATLAFGGERVNYSCVGNAVAVGPLIADANGLSARVGVLRPGAAGVLLEEVRSVRLRSVELQDPDALAALEREAAVEETVAEAEAAPEEAAPVEEAPEEAPAAPEEAASVEEAPEEPPATPEEAAPEAAATEEAAADEAPPAEPAATAVIVPLDPTPPPAPLVLPSSSGAPPAPLLGTIWGLQSIHLADGRTQTPGDRFRYTMVLAADGAAALQIDCNRAVGRFDLQDAALRFTPFAVTRALCPDEDASIAYLPNMQSVARYVFSDGRLALITEGDGAVLYFVSLN